MTAGSDAQFFLFLITHCAGRMASNEVQKIVLDFDLPAALAVERLLQRSGVQSVHSLFPALVERYSNALAWYRGELIAQEEILRSTSYASTDVSQESNGLVGIAPAVLAPSSGTRLKAGQASG